MQDMDIRHHKSKGVAISADSFTVSNQCGIAASKCNKILGLIRRNITYKNELIIPLYHIVRRI